MRLFGHRYRLQVDDFRFDGLDVRFDIERTLKPAPNNATITVTNLNPDHRKQLQQLDRVFVRLEAGWRDGIWEIFRGDLRDVITQRQGADWETVITSGDGERAITRSRVKLSLGPGASIETAVREIVSSMGVVIEDATVAQLQGLAFERTGATTFEEGVAFGGSSSDALDSILDGTGIEWSIQAGELRLLQPGQPVEGSTLKIAPTGGMVGSPEPGNKGITEVVTLMLPGIEPGAKVQLESEQIKGFFRAERVVYKGDTRHGDWHQHLDLKELK